MQGMRAASTGRTFRPAAVAGWEGAHLSNDHITVHVAVDVRGAFHADQAVLLGVVEPVAGAARANQALQLVDLDPDQLVHSLVAPDVQALSAQFHGPPWPPGPRSGWGQTSQVALPAAAQKSPVTHRKMTPSSCRTLMFIFRISSSAMVP